MFRWLEHRLHRRKQARRCAADDRRHARWQAENPLAAVPYHERCRLSPAQRAIADAWWIQQRGPLEDLRRRYQVAHRALDGLSTAPPELQDANARAILRWLGRP